MHAHPTYTPPNPAPGFGVLLRNLAALIAARLLHDKRLAPLTIPLWQLLTNAALRLDRLLARLAAGPLPLPRSRANTRSVPRRPSVFPTTRAWLIRALGAEAAAYAAQLEALLADPAAADLLASPAARRALAPIRRMLGLPAARPSAPASPAAASPRKASPRPAPIPHHPSLDPLPGRPSRPWWLPPPRLRSG